ncbi:MAG: bifunctional DNA-formamidopyrimidine glycosylase/DNA-(apurinic or apyrimidinic site) lyase [Pseudomonadota bacterium]
MPELPEVETVRRGLAPALENARIVRVTQRRPDLRFPFPVRFVERLEGAQVRHVGRRAKFLVVSLDRPDALIMHLGMSGRFTIDDASGATAPGAFVHDHGGIARHDHVVFDLSNGARITYNDPRRFGYMDLVAHDALGTCKHFAALGCEPLSPEFDANYLAARAHGRRQDLKAFLLDQRVVAGLGNIYVCEALYRAGLSPRRQARTLSSARGRPTARAVRLAAVIRDVLVEAIASGGSTLRDYAHADGALGYFQHAFRVYGREGEPCPDGSGHTIQRIVQAGRSTFYCGACQR